MVEPFSLGALGALAATEGIKFIYEQAREVLKRWRARKDGRDAESLAPIPVEGADVLNGTLASPTVNFEELERLHDDIKRLAAGLASYADEIDEPDPGDEDLAANADALRKALEVIYGQRISFKGEQREPSGPVVIGRAEVDNVTGYLAAVRARVIRSGRVEATLKATDVHGVAVAVEADTIG